jgi:hypothetical protein
MGLLSNLFGGGHKDNPANSAMPYLNQIPQIGHEAYDPYIEQGNAAGQRTSDQYQRLLSDPTSLINALMKGYEPSQGYQFKKDILNKEMSNTAAAGGVAGTPMDQMNQAEGVNGLLSTDMEQFLAHALGLYGAGLEGEQGIANKGFESSKGLADLLGNNATSKAGLAFQGKSQQNSNKSGLLAGLAKALGIGAGAVFGGVPGAIAVGSIFGGK